MADAEKTSNSFLDKLNSVQTSPLAALETAKFDQQDLKLKSDEEDMHN